MPASSPFRDYLETYRLVPGQTAHVVTHTSLADPPGAFHVPGSETENFLKMYSDAIEMGETFHLTERPPTHFPVVVDLDLRFACPEGAESEVPQRTYGDDLLVGLTLIYSRAIRSILSPALVVSRDRREGEDLVDTIEGHILQRDSPYVQGCVVKDGIHIIFPNVVLDAPTQRLVRQIALPEIDDLLATELPELMNDVESVVDECASKNNWMMHSSTKPGREPYKHRLIVLYRSGHSSSDEEDYDVSDAERMRCCEADMIWMFSIRRAHNPSSLSIETRARVRALVEADSKVKRKKLLCTTGFQAHENTTHYSSPDIELARKLAALLSPARADTYDSWMRVGWCLRNIDNNLLDEWVRFSQKSTKYEFGQCESLWPHYTNEHGLGIGTLHLWAKKDSPEEYAEIKSVRNNNLVERAVSTMSHFDVASVVHEEFKDRYACVSLMGGGKWYRFCEHRWHSTAKAVEMRTALSTSIHQMFEERATSILSGAFADESSVEEARKKACKYREMCKNLKTTGFKENVMREACDLFYRDKFEGALDSNPNLIGFENGVYDMDKGEFREGRPEDMISMSTGNDYVEVARDAKEYGEISAFFESVFPSAALRRYFLCRVASYMSGHNLKEEFLILTGSGSNGKSKTIELVQKVLGDYSVNLPTALLTQKRGASNAASPEVARLKGRRIAVMQEPSEADRLNVSILKEISGGDMVQARPLYGEPFEFRPQFSSIMTCNTLPAVPDNDGGTWRRIKVVEFGSKFTSKPDPDDPTHFPIDLHLNKKFDGWKHAFMCMLLDLYKEERHNPVDEPYEVNRASEEYRAEQDSYAQFVLESFAKSDADDRLTLSEVHSVFRAWAKQRMNMTAQKMSGSQLAKKLHTLGKIKSCDGRQYWMGWKINEENEDDYAADADAADADAVADTAESTTTGASDA
jgi:P4 family phage/plasmid primase-like protien